jgi:hypothetical protein
MNASQETEKHSVLVMYVTINEASSTDHPDVSHPKTSQENA